MLHARNGHRHGHVREQQFEDLRAEARELRSRMDAVLKLIKTPDLNLNAALERIIAAVVLHEAASSAAGEQTRDEDGEGEVPAGNRVDAGSEPSRCSEVREGNKAPTNAAWV